MDPKTKVDFIKNWIQKYVDSMPTKAKSLVIVQISNYNNKIKLPVIINQTKSIID